VPDLPSSPDHVSSQGTDPPTLARELYRQGRYADSAQQFRRAADEQPNDAGLHASLGAVLHRLGHLEEARNVLEKAVSLDTDSAISHDNLGVVLLQLGRREDALLHHRRALELKPDFAQARANHGLAIEQSGDIEAAEAEYREALRLDPKLVSPLCGLGRIHRVRSEFVEAEASFRKALKREPRRLTALNGLADVLLHSGRHSQALRLYRKAVRMLPHSIDAHVALANALSTAARDQEALAVYRRLERSGVGGFPILAGKAGCLSNLGRFATADRLYRKALALNPHAAALRSGYIFNLHAAAAKTPRAALRELRKWERLHGAAPAVRRRHHERDRDPDRPLRVGYISPDLRQHVVRQFFEPVMRVHDADNFQFYCYAELAQEDFASDALRAVADRWYRTFRVSDEEVAAQIDRDRIDILVDLAGHTANHRLGVMTHRPAPVQATYLGYFGSTGLSSIDYWITDPVLHPPGTTEPATETIYQLPRCSFCYGVPAHARVNAKRDSERSGVVFGCFNNASKVNMDVVNAWIAILAGCEGSRLVLKDRRFALGAVRRSWRERFARRGIEPQRVELLGNSPHHEYMDTYNMIDIALDPFPRTGGTTTCDALWMGVPVVTLGGGRYVERLSATKLAAVGVSELITGSVEEYIATALALAADRERLAGYHASLRKRMAASPLCDPLSLARALEDAYRDMWKKYLADGKSTATTR